MWIMAISIAAYGEPTSTQIHFETSQRADQLFILVRPSGLAFKNLTPAKNIKKAENAQSTCGQFTLRELTAATGNFSEANVLGEGGFGKVYKGRLSFAQMVAIKVLYRGGLQGSKEFVNEVEMLRLLKHPNLVKLIGYCAEGDKKLLVYEFMSGGSLADYLFGASPNKETLDWETRVDIALGVAKGLQYLHCTDPPIIHRDIKSSNILLGIGFQPKLADFGLAKIGPSGDRTHVSTRVMGTYGYCAPDYAASGKLNFKSDIYCLGVVLLELITGRAALDNSKPLEERDLVTWARLFLRGKKMARLQLIDPSFKGCFPKRKASRLVIIAGKCLYENPSSRPEIGHVVDALKYLQASKS